MSLGVKKIQTLPTFVKTAQGEYINANNITRVRPVSENNYTIEAVEGNVYVSTHTLNKKEAGKIIDFSV